MDKLAVAVMGVSGRMGQMLAGLLLDHDAATLVAATEAPGRAWIGQDLGLAMGGQARGVTVTDDPGPAIAAAQAVIDFTAPAATLAHSRIAAETGTALVVGTTGLSAADIASLGDAATKTALVRAGNMSLGVNLPTLLTRQVAQALGESFDIEIVESHHRHKVDAPSGTALMLGAAAAEGRGVALDDVAERGRDGITGARAPGAIGFAALRGGDVVGEHDVVFAGPGERIVLRHLASDRAIFARGAIRAALWAQGQPPGAYDMVDVLGLR
ncbi:MAG: 4-hydroxy-tetrahydrodipicolinate reductase [Pseudomonadota bacterium]